MYSGINLLHVGFPWLDNRELGRMRLVSAMGMSGTAFKKCLV